MLGRFLPSTAGTQKATYSFLPVKDQENLDKDKTVSGIIVYAGIFRNVVCDVLDLCFGFYVTKDQTKAGGPTTETALRAQSTPKSCVIET